MQILGVAFRSFAANRSQLCAKWTRQQFSAGSLFSNPELTSFRLRKNWNVVVRNYAAASPKKSSPPTSQVASKDRNYEGSVLERVLSDPKIPPAKTIPQKAAQATQNVFWFGVIVGAVVATGAIIYVVFSELFSSRSPNSVYSRTLKLLKNNDEILDIFGPPIKGFGEETRKGRHRHVSHQKWKVNGRDHMRVRFYIKGTITSGTVSLEMAESEEGTWDYRYLFVETNDLPPKVTILVDNR